MSRQIQVLKHTTPVPAAGPAHSALLQRPGAAGTPVGPALPIQRKLAISQPDDPYEREADRVAEQVLGTPEPRLQRRAAGAITPVEAPSIVHDVLHTAGRPLDTATRAFMEPRFGHDFSQVRVHTDAQAADSARAVSALAYTVGRDVVFGAEQYQPGTSQGQRLLAHELAHVVQQTGNVVRQSIGELVLRHPTPPPSPTTVDVTELFQILERFPAGPPITLYHVDSSGELLQDILRSGRDFNIFARSEFWLTTNVETRVGFKGGAGLNRIIAIKLDRRFVALMAELAMHQKEVGVAQKGMKLFFGIDLSIPRVNFEGGGKGKILPQSECNIAIRTTESAPEFAKLFKQSIVEIHLERYDPSGPAGHRLVPVEKLYSQSLTRKSRSESSRSRRSAFSGVSPGESLGAKVGGMAINIIGDLMIAFMQESMIESLGQEEHDAIEAFRLFGKEQKKVNLSSVIAGDIKDQVKEYYNWRNQKQVHVLGLKRNLIFASSERDLSSLIDDFDEYVYHDWVTLFEESKTIGDILYQVREPLKRSIKSVGDLYNVFGNDVVAAYLISGFGIIPGVDIITYSHIKDALTTYRANCRGVLETLEDLLDYINSQMDIDQRVLNENDEARR